MTYLVCSWSDFNNLTATQKLWLISESVVDSIDTVRNSVDETKFILKFEGAICLASVVGLASFDQYTYEEILTEIAGEDW
jgi:hypothetical protein